MEEDDFEFLARKLKLLKFLFRLGEVTKMLEFILKKLITTPVQIRSISKLKKSAIYEYLDICVECKLIRRLDLERANKDGSWFIIIATSRLKNFLEELNGLMRKTSV